MSEPKWRNRLTLDVDGAKKVVNEIAAKLTAHYLNGEITIKQLIDIEKLATDTARLKTALNWL